MRKSLKAIFGTVLLLSALGLGALLGWAYSAHRDSSSDSLTAAGRSEAADADSREVSSSDKKFSNPAVEGRIKAWHTVEDFPQRLAQFDTVFWDPRDTESLRTLIRDTQLVRNKTVLEIGCGTGLVSLCCLKAGARKVVATDVNPSAIANAQYNAQRLELADRFEARLVRLDNAGAYSVIGDSERFDLIISNPPWEDGSPQAIDEYALYDEEFELLKSLFAGLRDHLQPEGKTLLAYGCVFAIRYVQRVAPHYSLNVRVLDERDLNTLPDLFLPGMLLEVVPAKLADDASSDQ